MWLKKCKLNLTNLNWLIRICCHLYTKPSYIQRFQNTTPKAKKVGSLCKMEKKNAMIPYHSFIPWDFYMCWGSNLDFSRFLQFLVNFSPGFIRTPEDYVCTAPLNKAASIKPISLCPANIVCSLWLPEYKSVELRISSCALSLTPIIYCLTNRPLKTVCCSLLLLTGNVICLIVTSTIVKAW